MSDVDSGSEEDKEEELSQDKKKNNDDFKGMCFMARNDNDDDDDNDPDEVRPSYDELEDGLIKLAIELKKTKKKLRENNSLVESLTDRKSTRLNSSHKRSSRMPSSA